MFEFKCLFMCALNVSFLYFLPQKQRFSLSCNKRNALSINLHFSEQFSLTVIQPRPEDVCSKTNFHDETQAVF